MSDRTRLEKPLAVGAAAEPVEGSYFVAAYPPFSAWSPEAVPEARGALDRPGSSAPLGVYVHLPFCQHKCAYCYYLSYIAQPSSVVDAYVDAVVEEARLYGRLPVTGGRAVSFLYFGGGTPSLLTSAQLRRLVGSLREALDLGALEEFTFEAAPRSIRPALLDDLRAAGVTRLSLGVQSFDDALLRSNGRVHLAADVRRAWDRVRAAGFDHVNLDLMAGLIGETREQWRESVAAVRELGPESVTVYQTEMPLNTRLYRDYRDGTLPGEVPGWEEKRARVDDAFHELEAAGYTTVSAYNAVRDPDRHPFLYQDRLWKGADLVPLGVASFGYVSGVHFQNRTTLESYRAAVREGQLPWQRARKLTPLERLIREFILQLKLGAVDLLPFRERYGVSPLVALQEPLRAAEAEGWLTCSPERVLLTRPGLLRVDRLLPRFYQPAYRDRRYS
jgi:oxygen-independent coproporphyrinogen-3 oxidase